MRLWGCVSPTDIKSARVQLRHMVTLMMWASAEMASKGLSGDRLGAALASERVIKTSRSRFGTINTRTSALLLSATQRAVLRV